MLVGMRNLSNILRNKRIKNGSLNFDPVKSKVELDENKEPISVVPEPRNFAYDLIEDFMITANCAVAEFIESKKIPSIYRVHERPDEDKVKDFFKMLKYFKISVPNVSMENPSDYQKMLDKIKGTPLSAFLEQAFLRSMKIAVYSPVNIRHFGLALSSYTHFTSPIRRYADLIIHRILAFIISNERNENKIPEWLNPEYLKSVSNAISRREKLSSDAEREYLDFKKMQFLKKHEQSLYEGFITNVVNFGFSSILKDFLYRDSCMFQR
jgi:Exoribonuclease R